MKQFTLPIIPQKQETTKNFHAEVSASEGSNKQFFFLIIPILFSD